MNYQVKLLVTGTVQVVKCYQVSDPSLNNHSQTNRTLIQHSWTENPSQSRQLWSVNCQKYRLNPRIIGNRQLRASKGKCLISRKRDPATNLDVQGDFNLMY